MARNIELCKQISITVSTLEYAKVRREAIRRNITITELVYSWIKNKIDRIEKDGNRD